MNSWRRSGLDCRNAADGSRGWVANTRLLGCALETTIDLVGGRDQPSQCRLGSEADGQCGGAIFRAEAS